MAELQKFGPGFMIWNPQDRTYEVYFGDAGMQVFKVRQVEIQAQAEHDFNDFVDAYAGPVNA